LSNKDSCFETDIDFTCLYRWHTVGCHTQICDQVCDLSNL